QTSGSGNTFLLAVAFFFRQWEVPSGSGNFLTSSGNALCILFPTGFWGEVIGTVLVWLVQEVLLMVLMMHTEEDDTVLHIVKTGMLMLVVKVDMGGMTVDVVDKLTCSSDDVQPRQVGLRSAHALTELHWHDTHVNPDRHEVDQRVVVANTIVVTGGISLVLKLGVWGGVEKPGGGIISLLACFECGGTDHYKAAYPRLNRAPRLGGNHPNQAMAVKGGQGMDWLSRHKVKIVCHKKVVRIPLPNREMLRVLEERPEQKVRHLLSAKAKEQKLKDIIVIRNFSEEKLYAKFSKCELWLQEVQFLWHVINDDGLHVDSSKIEAVKNWEAPRTPSERGGCEDGASRRVVAASGVVTAAVMMMMESDVDDRIWVPLMGDVKTLIMDEAYKSRYSVHRGADKIYYNLRDMYWWPRMKKDIALYVSKCLTCSKIKDEHQRPFGLLQLTKSSHFLPIREDFTLNRLARLYLNEIIAWHGVPISIIFDRDSHFTSRFWQSMQEALRTSYHSSVRCAPFEALYKRKCRSPILWLEVREGQMIWPEIVQETTKKISQIKDRIKATCDRQKIYADKRRKPLEFSVGDHVLLKVSPWKGVVRFAKKGKLAPRFIRAFEITVWIGPVAYRLRLPEELNGVHDTFHVSNLKTCLADPTLHVTLGEIQVDAKLNLMEEPIEILD
nr:putative reverse transcriptase domain-containing protein [Tanacetum cinerariifolium]